MPEVEGARSVLKILLEDVLTVGDAIGFSEVNGPWRTGLTDALSVTTFALAGAWSWARRACCTWASVAGEGVRREFTASGRAMSVPRLIAACPIDPATREGCAIAPEFTRGAYNASEWAVSTPPPPG